MPTARLFTTARVGADCTGKTTHHRFGLLSSITAKYMEKASADTLRECQLPANLVEEQLHRIDRFDSITTQEYNLATQLSFYHDSQTNQDKVINLYLTLPAKNLPSSLPIHQILSSQQAPDPQYTFDLFRQNYHEAMDTLVYPFINNYPNPHTVFIMRTDRSWVCNLIYNTPKSVLFDDDALLNLITTSGYPPLDKVLFHICSPHQFEERYQKRLTQTPILSYPEAQGVQYLKEIQDRYAYLIPKLHQLGYITTYAIQSS